MSRTPIVDQPDQPVEIDRLDQTSDGGILANLLESAMPRGLGFSVQSNAGIRTDAWLFGEAQSRVIVTVRTEQKAAFERFLSEVAAPYEFLGEVTGTTVQVNHEDWGSVESWKRRFETVLDEIMA